MELADIIKWVDSKNQALRNAEFDSILEESNEQEEFIFYERVRAYEPECDKYSYAIIPYILQLSENDKKALIRRLFRNSGSFFYNCEKERKRTDDEGWVFLMRSNIVYLNCDAEELYITPSTSQKMVLEYELLGFYSEVIQLCVECGLNPNELHPIDVKNEVIDDIIRSMQPIPQKKRIPIGTAPKWQDYIIGEHREAWISLITKELNTSQNKNGKLMATIILALGQTGSLLNFKKRAFYGLLRKDFPLLNSDEAINKYLNTNSANMVFQEDIEAIKTKVGCY